MRPWQRRARLVMAALALAVVGLVAMTMRERQAAERPAEVSRVDPTAIAETVGGTMTQSTGTRVPGVVDFERMAAYADGTARLTGPRITSDRGGRQVVITGSEARVGPDQADVHMTGDVELATSDGWHARTGEASYSRGEGVVRAPGPVTFTRGAISGSAVGMTYDEQRDLLSLLDRAVVKFAPAEGTGEPADITAGTATYARSDNYMRFEHDVRMVRQGRVVESDTALALLAGDGGRLRALELRGTARVSGEASPGGLQAMTSRDMNLTYGGDGETLERAVLSGAASVQMAAAGAAQGRRIAGEHIDIALGPAGEVTALSARDRVLLTMPGAPGTPERTIRAAAMQGTGGAGAGLTAARFVDGVEFQEQIGSGTMRVARARTLDLAMEPDSGAIADARFAGATRFEEGALHASAADGRYRVAKGVLELSGAEAGKDPQVQDGRIAVEAKSIELTFEGPRLIANDAVRSVLQPAGGRAGGGRSSDDRTVPGMLKDDQPVYVTGAALNYDGGRSLATYTGGARLWQGETTIQGDTIAIDEHSGDLKADGAVRSAFVLEQADEASGGTRSVPSVASAEHLHYEDALRRATYTTRAHVDGPQGDCHADRIELYFVEAGGSLERAEAYRSVKLVADARSATGERMTYFAADERYVMSGAPVRIIEECRETTGKTLTFFRSTDRIVVDGNEEIRTLTKSGGTCTERRFE